MSGHRIYTTTPLRERSDIALEGPQAHYLGHVLRVRPDDHVTLFDGSGKEFRSTVTQVGRKRVDLRVQAASTPSTESRLKVTLLQSVLRGERMDFCVQKATELGVYGICPVFTERTVAKIPGNRVAKRIDHWQKIAISACEQSGRVVIPHIAEPQALTDAVSDLCGSGMNVLVLDPWADAKPIHSLTAPESGHVAVCIGPEGGFSERELDVLRSSGATPATCGPRVLRSETAGITAVAACQMAWGDW